MPTTRKVDWDLRDQFFVVSDEREALGFIRIDDRRLDAVLLEALAAHPAFSWDEQENGYVVKVAGKPQPIMVRPTRASQQQPLPVSGKPDPYAGKDPHWVTTAAKGHYTSEAGWRLDIIREHSKIPRDERGKQWRLTHTAFGSRAMWFKSKKLATEAVKNGAF